MTFNLSSLQSINQLRRRSQALAMLDAIVCPDWENRYYSFNAFWGTGESMGSMRNGSGDEWFILFGSFGAAIKGLAHETAIALDKDFASEVQNRVPRTFASFLSEPAFQMNWLSYCYWRGTNDSSWNKVVHSNPILAKTEDGSAEFLALLVEPASAYAEFAKCYYETDLSLTAIEHIYEYIPLTESIVKSLNSEVTIAQIEKDAAEIGYPIKGKVP